MNDKLYLLPVFAGIAVALALPNPGHSGAPEPAEEEPLRAPQCRTAPSRPARLLQVQRELGRLRGPRRLAGSVTVPVYFHVVRRGTGLANGDLADWMLRDQMRTLNDSFSGATGGAPTAFRFVLAGVTRTTNPTWYSQGDESRVEREMKSALAVRRADALNVYTIHPEINYYGWSSFPWDYTSDPTYDGIVVRSDRITGNSLERGHNGDTVVHEVGHWLGLEHTFYGGCSRTNDFVTDTPAERSAAYSCTTPRDSCTGKQFRGSDPLDNFMDYTPDRCIHKFTPGQAARMDQMGQRYRRL